MNGIPGTDAVAKGMQGRTQDNVGDVTITRLELAHCRPQPDIRLLERLVEGGQARCAHDGTSSGRCYPLLHFTS
jgi:hypothetical protein